MSNGWNEQPEASYTYDNVGNELTETLGDGEVTSYSYDSLNRLVGETQTLNGATLFSQSFALNPDGTRALSAETQVQPDGSIQTIYTNWTYDAEDRLTGESTSVACAADGLAIGFTLPSFYDFYSLNGGNPVELMWDGRAAWHRRRHHYCRRGCPAACPKHPAALCRFERFRG